MLSLALDTPAGPVLSEAERGVALLQTAMVDAVVQPPQGLTDEEMNEGRAMLAECMAEARRRSSPLGAIGLRH